MLKHGVVTLLYIILSTASVVIAVAFPYSLTYYFTVFAFVGAMSSGVVSLFSFQEAANNRQKK